MGYKVMRLFIAIEIPEDIRKKLASLQAKIGDVGKVKWVETENIHLTLKFLGETDALDEIKESLEKVKCRKFTSAVSGFGVFPNESYIRVIWAGMEPRKSIDELHEEIDDSLSHLGFPKDQKFHPHLTLGRVRSVSDKEKLKSAVDELKVIEKIGEFKIEKFKLKKSTLTPKGPVYEDVAIFNL